jgi:hypothetical protein
VSELYGELVVPIVSNGPAIASHFNLELGGRLSDWSMENMPTLETYKALIDWGIGSEGRYRMRGGFNRAFRAPNLGELFIARTQIFGGIGTRDHCSQNLQADLGYGASAADPAQRTHSYNLCRQLMGTTGAFEYYDSRPVAQQPTVGNTGVSNSFGNPDLREEQADTFTLGMVMDFHDNFTLTVDWYEIEIKNMIALENADAIYQRCLVPASIRPAIRCGSACSSIEIRRTARWERRSHVHEPGPCADVRRRRALDWRRDLWGGQFGMNTVANWGLESITRSARISPPSRTPATTAARCRFSVSGTSTGCSPRSATSKERGTPR